jgi:uncharacterized membrane protein (UPF0136 family)
MSIQTRAVVNMDGYNERYSNGSLIAESLLSSGSFVASDLAKRFQSWAIALKTSIFRAQSGKIVGMALILKYLKKVPQSAQARQGA